MSLTKWSCRPIGLKPKVDSSNTTLSLKMNRIVTFCLVYTLGLIINYIITTHFFAFLRFRCHNGIFLAIMPRMATKSAKTSYCVVIMNVTATRSAAITSVPSVCPVTGHYCLQSKRMYSLCSIEVFDIWW